MPTQANLLSQTSSSLETICSLMEDLSDSIICIDSDGVLIWGNQKAHKIIPNEIISHSKKLKNYISTSRSEKQTSDLTKLDAATVQFSSTGETYELKRMKPAKSSEDLCEDTYFFYFKAIKHANEQIQDMDQQTKLAVIGELASGVMHDIRNPLSAISSFNNYMLKQAIHNCDIKRMDKCQKGIEKAVIRIQRLSNHLRDFSRGEVEEPSEFIIKDFIDDSLLITKSRIGESGASVNVDYGPNDLKIIGRPHKLEQVLINLISNASDAVKIRKGAKIEITVEEESTTIALVIKDNGTGIKKEHLDRIFESFFTTKPRGSGTGLGLSICAGIIKDQGGQILVESTYGEGTTFKLILPKDITELENELDE